MEFYLTEEKLEQLSELAADLVRVGVKVIVRHGKPVTQRETAHEPVLETYLAECSFMLLGGYAVRRLLCESSHTASSGASA
jgi:hypothetical protein